MHTFEVTVTDVDCSSLLLYLHPHCILSYLTPGTALISTARYDITQEDATLLGLHHHASHRMASYDIELRCIVSHGVGVF